MREVGVVINLHGRAMYWHEPNASSVAIPDSRTLWDVLWEHRDSISGVAHTHPGFGPAVPSSNPDLTTFKAIEAGLGKRLEWWIATGDQIALVTWTNSRGYIVNKPPYEPIWLAELRLRSGFPVAADPAV